MTKKNYLFLTMLCPENCTLHPTHCTLHTVYSQMHTVNQVCLREAEPQAEVHVFLQGGPVQLQSLHLPPPPHPPPRPPPLAPDRLVIIPLINFILQRPFI